MSAKEILAACGLDRETVARLAAPKKTIAQLNEEKYNPKNEEDTEESRSEDFEREGRGIEYARYTAVYDSKFQCGTIFGD